MNFLRIITLSLSGKRLLGSPGSHRRLLLGGTAWSAGFKVAGTGLSFLTSLLLARLLTTEGYGSYYFLMAAVSLLGTLAGLGLPNVVTRQIAPALAQHDWGSIKGVLYFGYTASSLAAALVVGLAVAIGGFWRPALFASSWLPAWAGALLLLSVLNAVTAAALRGAQQIAQAQIPQIARMGLFAVLLAGIWRAAESHGPVFEMADALALQVGVAAGAFLLGVALLLRGFVMPGRYAWTRARASIQPRAWLASGLPLLLLGGLFTINSNADILMLGSIAGAEASGIYYVATRGANFLTFILGAAVIPLGPMVARLDATGEREALQRLLARSTLGMFAASLPLGLYFMFWGDSFLRLFGEAYVAGQPALVLLSAGKLFGVAAGPVGAVLIMTGHERAATFGVAIGTLTNVALNAALIPGFGATGAAAATAVSIVVWNILLARAVWRQTGLRPTILTALRRGA